MSDISLFDSATGESLNTIKEVDVSASHREGASAALLFAQAKRGRIVQLRVDCARIHYFLDEEAGRQMMTEDGERWGFAPGDLLALAYTHAPAAE